MKNMLAIFFAVAVMISHMVFAEEISKSRYGKVSSSPDRGGALFLDGRAVFK